MTKEAKERMVVVTTDNQRRGVFFGALMKQDGDIVVLKDAQMAVYWSAKCHGVLGLASVGPQAGSRISPIIPQIEINGVTSIMDCTAIAAAEWRKELWI